MSQSLAFNFSYFYRGSPMQSELLKQALVGVLRELPQLAGRGRVLGNGSRMMDSVVDCGNQGAEFAFSAAPEIR